MGASGLPARTVSLTTGRPAPLPPNSSCTATASSGYSIPHDCVSRILTVAADLKTVRILDGQTVIATHPRCFDRQQQIECPEHIDRLAAHKRAAGAHRGTDQLITLIPASRELLAQAVERCEPLGRTTRTLTELLEAYGTAELSIAIAEAMARGVPQARFAGGGNRQAGIDAYLASP